MAKRLQFTLPFVPPKPKPLGPKTAEVMDQRIRRARQIRANHNSDSATRRKALHVINNALANLALQRQQKMKVKK